MSITDWHYIANKAQSYVKEAAQIIRKSLKKKRTIEYKSHPNDLVTEMDMKIEAFFNEAIQKEFVDHVILGEEGTGKDLDTLKGIVWIIDPIDGTTNFVHQQRHFAISVGVYEDGVGKVGIIYDVMADELFRAVKGEGAFLNDCKLPMLPDVAVNEALIAVNFRWLLKEERLIPFIKKCRGTRSYGSATLEMAAVAADRIDAYISLNLSPWDFAAGAILLQEVGAKVSTIEGKELNFLKSGSVCVAKKGIHQQIQTDLY